jgi:hypothetical protein
VHVPASEPQHVAIGEHNGKSLHPATDRPVLERRRAGGVGGDSAAHRGAKIRWYGREPCAARKQRFLQRTQRDSRAGDDTIVGDVQVRQPLRAEHDITDRSRATGQR